MRVAILRRQRRSSRCARIAALFDVRGFDTVLLGVAAFVLSFIVSLLQPYIALSFLARRIILQKREAAAAAQVCCAHTRHCCTKCPL